jgi:hypothetical protein
VAPIVRGAEVSDLIQPRQKSDPRRSLTAAGEGCLRLYAGLVKGDADRDKLIQVIAHRGLHAYLAQHRDCAMETLLAWLQ